jgi:photosystem II stability/assembly factor-like uncharacterized protein
MLAADNTWTNILQDGGNLRTIAFDPFSPGTLYASGWGVFKSTDGGATWTAINSGLAPGHVNALALDPQTPGIVYGGHYGQGVFKSTNGGASWTPAGLQPRYVIRLALDPQNPALLYAATDQGLFRSVDATGTWSTANAASGAFMPACCSAIISAIGIDPQSSGVVYVGTADDYDGGGGLLKSTDGGASWQDLWPDMYSAEVYALLVDPRDPQQVYAGTDIGLLKSADGGATWFALGAANRIMFPVAMDPQNAGTIYAGSLNHGIFKSTDGGMSWAALPNAGVEGGIATALAVDPQNPDRIYAVIWGGLYRIDLSSQQP